MLFVCGEVPQVQQNLFLNVFSILKCHFVDKTYWFGHRDAAPVWNRFSGWCEEQQVKLALFFISVCQFLPTFAARSQSHLRNVPGLVSELSRTAQKAAAAEQLLPERPPLQDASVAARRHPLLTVQRPGPTTSTGPARIPGQWVLPSYTNKNNILKQFKSITIQNIPWSQFFPWIIFPKISTLAAWRWVFIVGDKSHIFF